MRKEFFAVISNGKSDGGLELNVGDKYRILETDSDAILIEKIGDPNNPLFCICGLFTVSIKLCFIAISK